MKDFQPLQVATSKADIWDAPCIQAAAALKEQGKCSRADWLNQLDRIHGKTKGPLPTFGNENRYSDIA